MNMRKREETDHTPRVIKQEPAVVLAGGGNSKSQEGRDGDVREGSMSTHTSKADLRPGMNLRRMA